MKLTANSYQLSERKNLQNIGLKSCILGLIWVMGLGSWVMPVFSQEKPVDLVYPELDAAHSRWIFFHSASRPFGMVNLSPDTELNGAWGSGYVYDTEEIKGFSHVHAWQLAGVSVMPVVSDKSVRYIRKNLASKFSHEDEEIADKYEKAMKGLSVNEEVESFRRTFGSF